MIPLKYRWWQRHTIDDVNKISRMKTLFNSRTFEKWYKLPSQWDSLQRSSSSIMHTSILFSSLHWCKYYIVFFLSIWVHTHIRWCTIQFTNQFELRFVTKLFVRPRVVNLKIAKMTSNKSQWREETTLETIPTMAWQVVQNVGQLVAGKETTIVSLLVTLIVAWIVYVRFVSSSHQLFSKKKLPPCEHQLHRLLMFFKWDDFQSCHLQIMTNITFQL